MARPRKFDDDALLDAALVVAGRNGADTTVGAIAAELQAPVGSLYHRVTGRDELLGRLWLREIKQFQSGLIPVLTDPDADAAIQNGVRHVVDWCDRHPAEARALTLFRQQDLAARVADPLREQVIGVNDALIVAMRDLTRRRYGRFSANRLLLLRIACQQVPYDLIRPHLGGPIPAWLADAAVAAALSVAARGDQ